MLSRRFMPPEKESTRSFARSLNSQRSERFGHALAHDVGGKLVEPGDEAQVLARREVRVERDVLGHVADQAPHGEIGVDVSALRR